MKSNKPIIFVCVVAAVMIVGLLLWFNRYSFSEMKISGDTFPVRTSRITGKSEIFSVGGWTQLGSGSTDSTSADRVKLQADDLQKLKGSARIGSDMIDALKYNGKDPREYQISDPLKLTCAVYNGTTYSLTELTVRLEIKQTAKQNGFIREYRLLPKKGGVLSPLSNGDFEAEIGVYPEDGTWSWGLVGASRAR